MSAFWSILDVASSIAFILAIPLFFWGILETRRQRRALQGMEPKEVVESARHVIRMAPAMMAALHAVQQAEHSKVKF